MIKFEEHDGLIFKMLDKPVPLTTDAELPCLTRLIQDDSRMGMFNRDTKPSRLSDFYLVARIVSNNIVVDEFMESDYNRFEIIGTPVAEGSAEWALYQMMQEYKVGDWVEYRLHANTAASDNNMMGQIIDIGRIGGTSIEVLPVGNYEHNSSLSTYHVIYASRIIRKLSPSEVIVKIGCLSGTVEDLSYEENGKFWLIGKATERHPIDMYVILYDEMLDTQTRELVEGLLEAQRRGDIK